MGTRRRIIVAISLLLAVAVIAVIGYRLLGGPSVSLLDAVYMAIVTLTGVGYAEVVDTSHNATLRIFNIFIVLFGVTIAVFVFSEVTAYLVEGEMRHLFRRRRMRKLIDELKGHFIVCGLGETGRYAVDELQKTGTPHVVIENTPEVVTRLLEKSPESYKDLLYVVGDATDERVLQQAGLDRAGGLISAVPGDKENLVIIVVVRQMNPAIRIVSRCKDLSFSERMIRAGANAAVSPNHIGGLRLASEMLRPNVVDFLDLMLQEKSRSLRIEELCPGENSTWNSKTIGGLNLGERYNLLVLALKNENGPEPHLQVNPPKTADLLPGAVVIVMGDITEIRRARTDVGKSSLPSA